MTSRRRTPLRVSKNRTLAAQVARRLREGIGRGDFPTGAPLREARISAQFGVSRVPVREALHQLEGEGFVVNRPRRGAVVAPLSKAEVIEIAEMCRLLEAHALRLAVPHMTRGILKRARAIVERLDRVDDLYQWARLNWEFHATLYQPAERPLLVELVGRLRTNGERYLYMLLADREHRLALNREHRSILAACRRGTAPRAARLLDAHLQGGKEKVLHLIDLER